MTGSEIVQVKRLRTIDELRARLAVLGIADQLGVDDTVDPQGPLCTPSSFVDGSTGAHTVGNRFAVLPMEGWDAEPDGHPSDLVRRRWRRFGESGAKLVWGGEAVAVRRDGRANPPARPRPRPSTTSRRCRSAGAHVAAVRVTTAWSSASAHAFRTLVGRPACQPLIAYHHPCSTAEWRRGEIVLSDDDLESSPYLRRRPCSRRAGFDFVDVRHCHGYLLRAAQRIDRPGAFGGSFEHRTEFLRRWLIASGRAPGSRV